MANVDFELQILMDQLSAMNLGTVMSEVQTSPAFRTAMIENLEAAPRKRYPPRRRSGSRGARHSSSQGG